MLLCVFLGSSKAQAVVTMLWHDYWRREYVISERGNGNENGNMALRNFYVVAHWTLYINGC